MMKSHGYKVLNASNNMKHSTTSRSLFSLPYIANFIGAQRTYPRAIKGVFILGFTFLALILLASLLISADDNQAGGGRSDGSTPSATFMSFRLPQFLSRTVPFPDARPFSAKTADRDARYYSSTKFVTESGDYLISGTLPDSVAEISGTKALFNHEDLLRNNPSLDAKSLKTKLKTTAQIADRWRDYHRNAKEQSEWSAEKWPLPVENLTFLDPPTSLVIEEQDSRSDSQLNVFRFKPIDPWHLRFVVDISQARQLNLGSGELNILKRTPLYSEYDFPERADEFARPGSMWASLRDKYKNATLSQLLSGGVKSLSDVSKKDGGSHPTSDSHLQGEAICHISALTTGNCYYLSESLEECAQRWGSFKFDVTMTEKCRNSPFWQNFLMREEARIKNEYTRSRKVRGAISTGFTNFVISPLKKICNALGICAAQEKAPSSSALGYIHQIISRWSNQETIASITVAEQEKSEISDELLWPRTQRSVLIPAKTVSSETCLPYREDMRFIPPTDPQRYSAPFGPPRYCESQKSFQYPITFGTPKRNMQTRLLPKLFDFHPIPLDPKGKPLNMNDEDLYQALAALSYYCPTHARGGWDCGRHYEVMGAGCVPFFIDIHAMPPHVLSQMPVRLFQEIVREPQFRHIGYVIGAVGDTYGPLSTEITDRSVIDGQLLEENLRPTMTAQANKALYRLGKFNNRSRVFAEDSARWTFDHSTFDEANYWRVARKLLKFTRKYLTSEALASYVLGTMGAGDAKRVLVVSRNAYDNLHMSLVTGLDGLGIDTTVVATADQHGLYKCFELLDSHSSGGLSLPWPDTVLLASQRINPGVRRHGVHGGGIPWANRARSTNKLNFATSLKTVTHRLFGHMNKDNFEESVRLLEAALGTPKGMNIPPAPVASSSGDFPTTTNQSATRPIDKKLQAEISLDERLAKAHRLEEELAVKEHNGIGEHSKILPYYDAIIVSFYSTSNFPYEILPILSRAVDHKVAVTDHEDSMGDPRKKSSEVAKTTYFFSRELRRVTC